MESVRLSATERKTQKMARKFGEASGGHLKGVDELTIEAQAIGARTK